jgi:hypothetical protein
MSVLQKEISVPANTTIENIYSGSAFEFARQNSVLQMALVGSATGLVGTVQVGARVVLEESPLSIKTSMPIIPDDFYYTEGVLANERIIARIRNTTAGALTVRSVCTLQSTGK